MKIKQIMLKNFANVQEVEINLTNSVTYLIGENGAGKTTFGLNAVWFILEGLSLKGKKVLHGDRFRFIGKNGKSATGKLVLHDETENIDITIQRKLLKNKTELKISASDNRELPATFIDDIFNIFSINPSGFAKLSPNEQSEALGVDTAKFDKIKKEKYDERKEIGYDVKRLKGAMEENEDVEKVEPVDLQKLLQEKDKIEAENKTAIEKAQTDRNKIVQEIIAYNQEQTEKQNVLINTEQLIKEIEGRRGDIKEKIRALEEDFAKDSIAYEKLILKRDQLPQPTDLKSTDIPFADAPTKSTTEINQQIQDAEETNQKAQQYQQYVDIQTKYKAAQKKHAEKQEEMDKNESDRIKYLKSCNLPYQNITIDDNGGVLINDRPFSETYFSKGEIIRMGAKIIAATNPKFKYVFIPDSQSIDIKRRENLFDELVEAGFQVVAEYVDTEKQKNHGSILLKESKVVESYEEKKADLDML